MKRVHKHELIFYASIQHYFVDYDAALHSAPGAAAGPGAATVTAAWHLRTMLPAQGSPAGRCFILGFLLFLTSLDASAPQLAPQPSRSWPLKEAGV